MDNNRLYCFCLWSYVVALFLARLSLINCYKSYSASDEREWFVLRQKIKKWLKYELQSGMSRIEWRSYTGSTTVPQNLENFRATNSYWWKCKKLYHSVLLLCRSSQCYREQVVTQKPFLHCTITLSLHFWHHIRYYISSNSSSKSTVGSSPRLGHAPAGRMHHIRTGMKSNFSHWLCKSRWKSITASQFHGANILTIRRSCLPARHTEFRSPLQACSQTR